MNILANNLRGYYIKIQNMVFKRASELNEFLQIHQLNYKTFVEEIPQHQQNAERMLVDKFHDKNHYIVAKRGENVIGMVCYNLERPFSVEGKIENFESYLPKYNSGIGWKRKCFYCTS